MLLPNLLKWQKASLLSPARTVEIDFWYFRWFYWYSVVEHGIPRAESLLIDNFLLPASFVGQI